MRQTRKHLREMADEKGYLFRKNRKRPTLRIWEDGSITRVDIDLTLATKMTVKQAYRALEIK